MIEGVARGHVARLGAHEPDLRRAVIISSADGAHVASGSWCIRRRVIEGVPPDVLAADLLAELEVALTVSLCRNMDALVPLEQLCRESLAGAERQQWLRLVRAWREAEADPAGDSAHAAAALADWLAGPPIN